MSDRDKKEPEGERSRSGPQDEIVQFLNSVTVKMQRLQRCALLVDTLSGKMRNLPSKA